jgi:hypothetical protein
MVTISNNTPKKVNWIKRVFSKWFGGSRKDAKGLGEEKLGQISKSHGYPADVYIPTDIRIYNAYLSRCGEFDSRFLSLLTTGNISEHTYEVRRHYYALLDEEVNECILSNTPAQ